MYPINIPEFYIYDILINDLGNLVIIQPFGIKEPDDIELVINNMSLPFHVLKCTHKRTYIYYTKFKGDSDKIFLKINGTLIQTTANKYPKLENKILMSTIVKDEDKYIKQWINYHLNLGIDKFIIYDNSTSDNLSNYLEDYIQKEIVILIKWSYPYICKLSGPTGQPTHQNHSLHAFKSSKYIGLMDIDEYVNPQDNFFNIDKTFESFINKNNLDMNNYSGFRLLNRFFYNPDNLNTDGYKFLNIYNCDNITLEGREKNFVIPKNCDVVCVHVVSNGLPLYTPDKNLIFFNHYFYLNKNDRGRNRTKLMNDSIKNKVTLL
jgi:hypothetical protein